MESLNSSHSSSNTTTTSNFSKDSSTPHDSSTPPSSPHGKYYSPAGRLSSIRANHVCLIYWSKTIYMFMDDFYEYLGNVYEDVLCLGFNHSLINMQVVG